MARNQFHNFRDEQYHGQTGFFVRRCRFPAGSSARLSLIEAVLVLLSFVQPFSWVTFDYRESHGNGNQGNGTVEGQRLPALR